MSRGWIHSSCEAMYNQEFDSQAPTAPLAEFIEEYDADDNVWWMIGCGHHQNLFDAAVSELADERKLADDLADVLSRVVVGWEDRLGVDLAQYPDAVLARYREARSYDWNRNPLMKDES